MTIKADTRPRRLGITKLLSSSFGFTKWSIFPMRSYCMAMQRGNVKPSERGIVSALRGPYHALAKM